MGVTGVEVEMGSIKLDPTHALAVYADTVILPRNGVVRMPSKAVCMSAREIICNGATMDTSGLDSVRSYRAGASAGSQGAAGTDYLGPAESGGKGGTGGAGVGEIEGIAELEGEAATFASYIKKVQKIVETAADMQKSFTSIKSTITKAMPDASKNPIAEANFDKVIKPYLALLAAEQYKALMYAFLALVQARNKHVVRLNQLHSNEVALAANQKDRTANLRQVQAGLAANQNPDLSYFPAHMDALVHDLRLRILAMLFAENQAFHYRAFSDECSIVSSDATLANLSVAQTTVETNITNLVNQKVGSRQTMNDVRITLDAGVDKDSFEHFFQSGTMHFALTSDNPAYLNLAEITLTKYRVEINGAKPFVAANNRIFANLTQHGTSTFITRKKRKVTFSHKHRTASHFYFTDSRPASGGQLVDQNGDLIQVSPFAAWTLDVSQTDNANIDLSSVTSIELIFDGWYT